MKPLRPAQIQKRLIQRQGLDRWGQLFHHGANLAADIDVKLHTRLYHNRLGTAFERLKHRHCGFHTAHAGNITGR